MSRKISYEHWKRAILEHLSEYKKEVLNVAENGIYHNNPYAHILPNEKGELNFLIPEIKTNGVSRHTNWMHLNSSQVMCWNFFTPMSKNHHYDFLNGFLNKLLERNDIEIKDSQFEHSLVVNSGKKSSEFDFWCIDSQLRNYYFEIKYTEQGIATATGAKNPDAIFEQIYQPLIDADSYLGPYKNDSILFMQKHYQTYRNIVMANESKGDYCIFVTMKENPATKKELSKALQDIGCSLEEVENRTKLKNVISVYWEDIVPLALDLCSETDKKVFEEFKRKYLLSD